MITFSVAVTPRPQPRPRVVKGHAYEPKDAADYKKTIALMGRVAMRGRPVFSTPVSVCITIRRNVKATSRNFGDIDNHVKAILDALNKVVFADDALVVSLSVQKLKSADEGVDITVSATTS